MEITSTATLVDTIEVDTIEPVSSFLPAGDGGPTKAAARDAPFPPGTVGWIFQPSSPRRSGGPPGRQRWHLRLERPSPALQDQPADGKPGSDPLALVDLTFPTLEAAIAHAERQGLPYLVEKHPRFQTAAADCAQGGSSLRQAFQEALSTYLLFAWWDAQYGRGAMPPDPDGPATDVALPL